MTYRTRIPGTVGTEVDFESRETGKAVVEAVRVTLPFVGGATPILVGKGRRRHAEGLAAANSPSQQADAADPDDTNAHETPHRR